MDKNKCPIFKIAKNFWKKYSQPLKKVDPNLENINNLYEISNVLSLAPLFYTFKTSCIQSASWAESAYS